MKISVVNIFQILILSCLIGSCARNPVTGKKEFMLMSESQEMALGKQSDPAIIDQYGLYKDESLQEFINEKGKAMGAISHKPDLDYQFRILDSPVVNAFAVPGGYVYFTRGIMAHFNNEAEFAGVLGHEIGHITARHSAKQYSTQMIAQLGLLVGVVASEEFRPFASDASQLLGLLFLKFGRDHESQSDELGVQYSTLIGYNSHEMADFFKTLNRLQGESGNDIPTFLSTHPNPVDRFKKVHMHSDKAQIDLDKSKLLVNKESYLNLIDGIVYGEDPRQGYTDDNVFYHPELKIRFPYPKNWNLHNSPSQVQIVPEDGKALMIFTLSPEKTLSAASQAHIEKFKFNVIDSRKITLNGFPSYVVLADINSEDPNPNEQEETPPTTRVLNYYIKDGDIIYVFHGMSNQDKFNSYTNSFKQTMNNFKRLTSQSRINVKPTRIVLKKTIKASTFQNALISNGVATADLEELAIVNGMLLTDNIEAGISLKIFSKKHND